MHNIKKFLKFCLIVLIIALIGFVAYRYYTLKKEGKLDEVFAKNEMNKDGYETQIETSNQKSNSDNSSQEEEKSTENNNSEKFVVEEKNYDNYYNQFNFDNRLLLYEGNQQSKSVKEALDILISDADDSMYSKPTVAFKNFNLSTDEISANNLEEYKSILKEVKNLVGDRSCTISFEYNKLKTYVNKIIITKN